MEPEPSTVHDCCASLSLSLSLSGLTPPPPSLQGALLTLVPCVRDILALRPSVRADTAAHCAGFLMQLAEVEQCKVSPRLTRNTLCVCVCVTGAPLGVGLPDAAAAFCPAVPNISLLFAV